MPPTRVAEELQRIINQCRPRNCAPVVLSDSPRDVLWEQRSSEAINKSAPSRRGRSKYGAKRSRLPAMKKCHNNRSSGNGLMAATCREEELYFRCNVGKNGEMKQSPRASNRGFSFSNNPENGGYDFRTKHGPLQQGLHPPLAHSHNSQNSHPKCTTSNPSRGRYSGRRPVNNFSRYQEDLSMALGIPSSECTTEKKEYRKLEMQKKLVYGENIRLTMLEEYDVHCRAETYVRSINPDRDFCISPGHTPIVNPAINKVTEVSYVQLGKPPEPEGTSRPVQKSERKRRRHSCGDIECYVVHPSLTQLNQVKHGHSFMLPEGLCLLRPTTKLVELVAQAINDSPDSMLQVQQVYVALQNKYPYFQYMDKSSTTSWRSSIRHALFQKWFRKIPFTTELINCRGCYWAINRRYHPREWTLPPNKYGPGEEILEEQDEPEDLSIATMITAAENNVNNDSQTNKDEEIEYHNQCLSGGVGDLLDLSPEVEDLTRRSCEKLIPRPRDPDPMLSPQEDEVPSSQEEMVETPESSNDESPVLSSGYVSDSSSFKLVYDDEHSPVLVYEPKDLSERDYTESLEWICKEDTCPTSRDEVYPFLDYPTPMYGPLCVSYAVPPASMPDTKNIDDLPVYIQTYQLNGEQW